MVRGFPGSSSCVWCLLFLIDFLFYILSTHQFFMGCLDLPPEGFILNQLERQIGHLQPHLSIFRASKRKDGNRTMTTRFEAICADYGLLLQKFYRFLVVYLALTRFDDDCSGDFPISAVASRATSSALCQQRFLIPAV
ncbi:hypothetical protein U1Q18_016166 [Sarracenia purpurea var. burkii]